MAETKLIRNNMPELDSLRGIAILGVVLLHGFYWQYSEFHFAGMQRLFVLATKSGWLGVNLFFVLSGFLITGILLDSRSRPEYYRRFYKRRALRILPAYYSLLILLAILRQVSPAYLGLSFIYLANVTVLFGVPNDYGPLWSLAVEEHYYILWPALVRRLNPYGVAWLAFAICVIEPGLRAWAFATGHASGIAAYTWFVADGLATGSLLAAILRTTIKRQQVNLICAGLLASSGGAIAIGSRQGLLTRDNLLGAALQHTLIDIVFAGVLLMFLLLGTSSARSYVDNAALKFLGYISYGLYLIHLAIFRIYDKLVALFWPALQPADGQFGVIALRFFVVASFSVGLAYLSRRFYEERFLRLKERWTPKENWDSATLSSGATGGRLA